MSLKRIGFNMNIFGEEGQPRLAAPPFVSLMVLEVRSELDGEGAAGVGHFFSVAVGRGHGEGAT